jgi:hypothetical protein
VRAMNRVTIAIIALVALVPLTLSGCSLLLSGGVGNIIRNHKPAPDVDGPTITRKRLAAMQEIEAALAVVDAGARSTSYATATDDRCDKGENDAFTRDGYAHRCTVRMTRFYGTSGGFRAHMLGLEDLLASSGWQLPRSTFREMFANYYDVYCDGRRIAVFGSGPGVGPECEVSKLPRSRSEYKKGDLLLWIECGERGGDNLYVRNMMEIMQRVPVTTFKEGDRRFDLYKKQNLQNVNALIEDITASHKYVLSVTIQKTYFEN